MKVLQQLVFVKGISPEAAFVCMLTFNYHILLKAHNFQKEQKIKEKGKLFKDSYTVPDNRL